MTQIKLMRSSVLAAVANKPFVLAVSTAQADTIYVDAGTTRIGISSGAAQVVGVAGDAGVAGE